MVKVDDFKVILDDIVAFKRNLDKDNQSRRQNLQVTQQKKAGLDEIENRFTKLRADFNKGSDILDPNKFKQAKVFVENIEEKINEANEILNDRLSFAVNLEKERENSSKMGEKFDLKTAASLLPVLDGTDEATKQLIDCIELYKDMLDENGQKLLITYVLKAKLSQSAKLRLEKEYATVDLLVQGMKRHLLSKKSAAALSTQLHNVKQHQKTISEFGLEIENLFVNLTITQSEGDEKAEKVLSKVNEKVAINSFANGLRNHELRTVIKARNYDTLKDAITGAMELDVNSAEQRVFHIRNKNSSYKNKYNYSNHAKNPQVSRNHNKNNHEYTNRARFSNQKYDNKNVKNTTANRFRNRKHYAYSANSNNLAEEKCGDVSSVERNFFRSSTK